MKRVLKTALSTLIVICMLFSAGCTGDAPIVASRHNDSPDWVDPAKPDGPLPTEDMWVDPGDPWKDPAKPDGPLPTEDMWVDPAKEWEELPKLDFSAISVVSIIPFSEEIGWVQYRLGNENLVSAIHKDGSIVATFDEAVRCVSYFDSGYAFVQIIEGPVEKYYGYYGIPYNKVGISYYDIIIDKDGNRLYDSRYPLEGSDYRDEIVAHGDGKFVVCRHESSISTDQFLLGTIDAYGNTIDPFVPTADYAEKYDFYAPTFVDMNKENSYLVNYLHVYNVDERTHGYYKRYLGNDCFVLDYLDNEAVLYQPGAQKIRYLRGKDVSKIIGNKLLVNVGPVSGVYCYDLAAGGFTTLCDGQSAPYGCFSEDMVYSTRAHAYLDFSGNQKIVIKDYPDLEIHAGIFYGDHAVIGITGADQKQYASVIDRSGALLFDPVPFQSLDTAIYGDCFLIKDDSGWKLYDVNGTLRSSLPWESVNWLGDGYAYVSNDYRSGMLVYLLDY